MIQEHSLTKPLTKLEDQGHIPSLRHAYWAISVYDCQHCNRYWLFDVDRGQQISSRLKPQQY